MKKAGNAESTKATFYLAPEAASALEDAWITLRTLAGPSRRTAVSKPAIVEFALLIAERELAEKGKDSELAVHLLSGIGAKP
jgi:hypothetical protein